MDLGPTGLAPANLDPDLAALCAALPVLECCALAMGQTFVQAMQAWMALRVRPQQRLHTGYTPKAQRRAMRHGLLDSGIVTLPPKDPNARIIAEAQKWGHAC